MKTNRLDDHMNALLALAFIAITVLAAFDVGHEHYFGRSGEIKLSQATAQSLNARKLRSADQPVQAVATGRPLAVVAMR
jgi:hypothetical protein